MIFFLYGEDTYRSRQKLNEIIDNYKKIHKSGLNLKYFDGTLLNFEDFKDAIQQVSMFDEKKLMVLTNIFSNQDFKEKILKKIKEFLNLKDIIIFYEKGVSEDKKFLEFLKKQTKSQEFQLLEGEKLKSWVKKEFSKYKTEISPEALDKLINFIGNDLWQMSNEIKKLVSYRAPRRQAKRQASSLSSLSLRESSMGEGGKENEVLVDYKKTEKIGTPDIELLVKPKIESDIFKTIDAIALKNKKQALELIHKHLEKGDAPLYLLSMINFQFRNLLIIKDLIDKNLPYYSILKISKLHPFVVKKSFQQAQKFNLQELKKIYQKIFQVDFDIKTGKIEPETALDLLLSEI